MSKVTAEALAPHEGGEAQTVLRKSRITALKCVFDEVKKTFDRWRLGGQYVDSEDRYKHSMPSTGNKNYDSSAWTPNSSSKHRCPSIGAQA